MPGIRPSRLACYALLALAATACRPYREAGTTPFPPPPPGDAFTVMTYNVNRFGLADRDGDGQADDFKPEPEIAVIAKLILQSAPDVVAVQEIGSQSALEHLRDRLGEAGLAYPHLDVLEGHTRQRHLGLMSRHPFTATAPVTNLTFSIRENTWPVQRGFQQVELAIKGQASPVRLLNVHLKSKTYHDAGQTEMRRNEARLLATLVRRLQRENPGQPLILCGDFSDTENSAALRELIGGEENGLIDLPLADRYGDRWTCFTPEEPAYVRSDYIMVNEAMKRYWREDASGIVRGDQASAASDHRPVIAAFTLRADP